MTCKDNCLYYEVCSQFSKADGANHEYYDFSNQAEKCECFKDCHRAGVIKKEKNMKPIYEPKGKAKEYGDLAINIYTGCPHNCFYCFAPNVLHKDRKTFHSEVKPRENIVEAVKKQLKDENISGKLIHLCFTCDPYPTGYDTTPTREIIKAIKDSGNNV